MDSYTVTMADGYSFTMWADLTQASAPLRASFFGDDDQGTPCQTADACHCATKAARLVAEYFDVDSDVAKVE